MHLKDIEAAVTEAHAAVYKAGVKLQEVMGTIAEEDHKISVSKELEKGNALVAMAEKINELEGEIARRIAAAD